MDTQFSSHKWPYCFPAAQLLASGFGLLLLLSVCAADLTIGDFRKPVKTKDMVSADFVDLLSGQSGIVVRNKAALSQKLARLKEDGKAKLQLIVDFDRTLTKYYFNGKPGLSTHGMFSVLPDLGEKVKRLFDHYYPIEHNPNLTTEEKIPHMVKWWTDSHAEVVKYGFKRSDILALVQKSHVALRDRTDELFAVLQRLEVPIFVFSAGIGDLIKEILADQMPAHKVPRNLLIVANMMAFNEEGICTGFEPPLIHTFNKNSTVIQSDHHKEWVAAQAHRTNVLLMGDMIGDVTMDHGVVDESTVVRLGFLNEANPDKIKVDQYAAAFDVVVIDDQTMSVPLLILGAILGEH